MRDPLYLDTHEEGISRKEGENVVLLIYANEAVEALKWRELTTARQRRLEQSVGHSTASHDMQAGRLLQTLQPILPNTICTRP